MPRVWLFDVLTVDRGLIEPSGPFHDPTRIGGY